ncbi:MAG TPA: hypothetical protein VLM79_37220 [Kofleriaceae bacterium]|nr:hypothetical protein [Kofleriaceae bacterium]
MRSSIACIALGLAVSATIGCSGDDSSTPDAPAAATFKGYDADEGGEIRIEHVRLPDGQGGVVNFTRIVGYVLGTAGSTKFFSFPMVPGCTDTTNKKNWPVATNPIAERVYLDPGNIIIQSPTSLTNAAPKPALTLPRQTAEGGDFLARVHPANKWFSYNTIGTTMVDGDAFLTPDTFLDVIITGSADMPGQVFHNVSWMPNDFPLTSPGLADKIELKANTPMTFKWTIPKQDKPADMTVVSLVGFVGGDPSKQGPAVLCIEPDDGEVTVPGNMIDVVRAAYPGGGIMARQTFTHVPKELIDKNGPTGRRLDIISTWCYANGYTVAP